MAVKKRTTRVATGYKYRVYLGCDTRDGRVVEATADRMIGGWAPSAEAARKRANDVLA